MIPKNNTFDLTDLAYFLILKNPIMTSYISILFTPCTPHTKYTASFRCSEFHLIELSFVVI